MMPLDLQPLLPILVLSAAIVAVLLAVSIRRNHGFALFLTLAGLAGSAAAIPLARQAEVRQVTPLLLLDDFAFFIVAMILAASFAVALLAHSYLQRRRENPEEFYILLLLATLGTAVLAGANHFASFFLGLETLSVSLYAMISYTRSGRLAVEAGLKYLVLAGASSAFLLFGMALLYAELGTMQFEDLAALMTTAPPGGVLILAGIGLMIVGAGFKLAVVPFHFWTPDVYEGAPAPVTAFVATVSKGGMVAVLLRFFLQIGMPRDSSLFYVMSAIAVASMIVGNLLALLQTNVKRILAYSSISHLGYLLVAFLAGGAAGSKMASEAVLFYLIAYMATSIASFGVVSAMSGTDRDADSLEDFRGLYWRKPWLAAVMTVSLMSLAGIPLTAGFVGKFYVLSAGMEASLYALVILLVLNSAVGVFYYLRVVVAMLWTPEVAHAADGAHAPTPTPHLAHEGAAGVPPGTMVFHAPWVPLTAGAVLTALLLLLVWLGVQPAPLQKVIQSAVMTLK
ncbi:MAG TPA: NADH-quinone oxidoreductase subunit N [bacterium]|nr:NADH-quinone oxidoreductase subunit N [bacterium]